MKKILLTAVALVIMSAAGFAESGETGTLTWTFDDGTLTISGTGEMPDYEYSWSAPWYSNRESITTVLIEDGVKSIGSDAFGYLQNLTSITIPNSVTSIGGWAFIECRRLASITLPSNLTSIGGWAFSYCRGLTSITIPSGVTNIGESVFHDCRALTDIQVEDGNTHFSSADGVLINNDEKTLIHYPAGKQDENYIVPSGVTSIGHKAFYDCRSLTSVVIPEGVTSIGEESFAHSKLKTVSIAKSVTLIDHWAFYSCQDLTDVTVFWDTPSDVTLSPKYTNDVFEGINKSAVFLHVPDGTTAAYQAIKTWKDFYGIDWTLLIELTVNAGALNPDFSTGIFSYSLIVPHDVEEIFLTAIPFEGSNSTVSGKGVQTLNTGKNIFEITVIASYGIKRNYTVTVFRLPEENYLLGLEGYTDKYTSMYLNVGNGTTKMDVITGRYLYYILQTGSFSGNLPLHFDLGNGITCERTVTVQSNSLYKITLDVSIDPDYPITVTTPYDNYGRPGTPYVKYTYYPWTIKASDGDHIIQSTETTVPGTPAAATVSDVTMEGSLTGISNVEKYSLRIYPNPVAESFYINGITTPTQVTVTDLGGRTVLTQKVNCNEPVAVGHLPKGVYIVRVNGTIVKLFKK
jgi:hypothetical protein